MKVEIWSDVVCPWCHIGKRRLETALEEFAHRDEVEILWRSFELDPSAPVERQASVRDHLAAKYGTPPEEAQMMMDRMREVAAREGLDFRFDRARGGNTFDAHRLLHMAAERGGQGMQGTLKERLLTAYLTDGESIGDRDTLVRLAVETGMNPVAVREVLDSGAYADEVRRDQSEARSLGINGVPFFVIDRLLGVSGAQPADLLLGALEQAWAAANPLTVVGGGADAGDACADGSCAV